MLIELTPTQCRIIGVLLEKEVTTPEQYPLSLNSLTSGCNQKSSREPIMSLAETEVQQGLDELKQLKQISEVSGFGSRVVKYKHRFCNTEFGDLQLSPQQLAIVCVLLLRGAQTPGELRTRCNRMAEFDNAEQVELCLTSLANDYSDSLVKRLPREPGKREARYMHLFCPEALRQIENHTADVESSSATVGSSTTSLEKRVEQLEAQLIQMQNQLDKLMEII